MNKDDIKFEIEQLRQDKLISTVEVIAVNSSVVLGLVVAEVSSSLFHPQDQIPSTVIFAIFLSIGLAYSVAMGFVNLGRLQKIERLEKKLKA